MAGIAPPPPPPPPTGASRRHPPPPPRPRRAGGASADVGRIDQGSVARTALLIGAVLVVAVLATMLPTESRRGSVEIGLLDREIEATETRCAYRFHERIDHAHTCGRLDIVEDDMRQRLAFVVFEADPAPDDPLPPLYLLHGGPGIGVLDDLWWRYATDIAPHLERRDVVVFDQRGSGYSVPVPICVPFVHEFESARDDDDELVSMLRDCLRRTRVNSARLETFTVAASADDVATLAHHLGHERVALFGESWGGRLAEEVIRRHPEIVHAAVIEGGLDDRSALRTSMPVTFRAAVQQLSDHCDQVDCFGEAGDGRTLETRLLAVGEMLHETPIRITLRSGEGNRFSQQSVDDQVLANTIFSMLYDSRSTASVPALIVGLERDDPRLFERFANRAGAGLRPIVDLTFGAHMCNDVPLEPADGEPADLAPFYELVDDVPDGRGETSQVFCETIFGDDTQPNLPLEPPSPRSRQVPVLFVAGAFDPITGIADAERFAQDTPRARSIHVEAGGHVLGDEWCVRRMIDAFLVEPARLPDTSCLATVIGPAFHESLDPVGSVVDHDAAPGVVDELIGSNTTTFDRPASWFASNGSTWWRDAYPSDDTALVVFSGDNRSSVLAMSDLLESWEAFSLNRRVPVAVPGWQIDSYVAGQGMRIDVASRTIDRRTVHVALIAHPDEAAELRSRVLEPTLRSLRVNQPGAD